MRTYPINVCMILPWCNDSIAMQILIDIAVPPGLCSKDIRRGCPSQDSPRTLIENSQECWRAWNASCHGNSCSCQLQWLWFLMKA